MNYQNHTDVNLFVFDKCAWMVESGDVRVSKWNKTMILAACEKFCWGFSLDNPFIALCGTKALKCSITLLLKLSV